MKKEEIKSLILQREIKQTEDPNEKFESENQEEYKRKIPLTLGEKEEISRTVFNMVTNASNNVDLSREILPL